MLLNRYGTFCQLQTNGVTVAHSTLCRCQELLGASSVTEIPSKLESVLGHVRDTAAWIGALRQILGVEPAATLADLDTVLRGYLRNVGFT